MHGDISFLWLPSKATKIYSRQSSPPPLSSSLSSRHHSASSSSLPRRLKCSVSQEDFVNVVDPFCGGHSSSSGGLSSAGANHPWLNPCMPQGGGVPMCHHSGPGPPGLPSHTTGGPISTMGLGKKTTFILFILFLGIVLNAYFKKIIHNCHCF